MCSARADVRFTPESDIKCDIWKNVRFGPKANITVLSQFEYPPHHWHACAANLGRGHPASTLIGTCHEPARSPHFHALTDRLCKAQICLGVQVREQADQRNICAARSGILRYSIERCKHP